MSAMSDAYVIVQHGANTFVGGTSAACPVVAGKKEHTRVFARERKCARARESKRARERESERERERKGEQRFLSEVLVLRALWYERERLRVCARKR